MVVICLQPGSISTSIADKQVELSGDAQLLATGGWCATADNRELSAVAHALASHPGPSGAVPTAWRCFFGESYWDPLWPARRRPLPLGRRSGLVGR